MATGVLFQVAISKRAGATCSGATVTADEGGGSERGPRPVAAGVRAAGGRLSDGAPDAWFRRRGWFERIPLLADVALTMRLARGLG